jgi:hypothetical protein
MGQPAQNNAEAACSGDIPSIVLQKLPGKWFLSNAGIQAQTIQTRSQLLRFIKLVTSVEESHGPVGFPVKVIPKIKTTIQMAEEQTPFPSRLSFVFVRPFYYPNQRLSIAFTACFSS